MNSAWLLALAFLLLLPVACNEVIRPAPGETVISFGAMLEEGASIEDLGFAWAASDKIAVKGSSSGFIRDGEKGFKGAAVPSEKYLAVYPYHLLEYFAESPGSAAAVMKLPEFQTAVEGSVCHEGFSSVAYADSENEVMTFMPVFSFVRFTLSPEYDDITSVSLMDREGGRISGMFSVDCASDDPLVFPMPDSYSNVVLRPEGRCLDPGVYHIAVFSGIDWRGFVLAFENDEGKVALVEPYAYDNETVLERGEVLDIGNMDDLEFKSWEMSPVKGTTALTVSSSASDIYVGIYSRGDFRAFVDSGEEWLDIVRTKDVSTASLHVHVAENNGAPRIGRLTAEAADGNSRLAFHILQHGNDSLVLERQRKILEDFYRSTNGNEWICNDNWCTDLPLKQWYGVSVNAAGAVAALQLGNNNLSGTLPPDIGDLACSYTRLSLYGNNLTGTLPSSVYKLHEIDLNDNAFTSLGEIVRPDQCPVRYIDLADNMLEGSIPQAYGMLPFLTSLDLSNNFLSGNLPSSFSCSNTLGGLYLNGNCFSGPVPEWLMEWDNFDYYWPRILVQNGEGFDLAGVKIKGPSFSCREKDGRIVGSDEIYASNEYTLLYDCLHVDCDSLDMVDKWFRAWHDSGFEVVSYGYSYGNLTEDYEWKHLGNSGVILSYLPMDQEMTLVDRDGYIVVNPIDGTSSDVLAVLEAEFGILPPDAHVPEDERDGAVSCLQKAEAGSGIDLIFMGDAYTADDIASGTYRAAMETAMEAFFDIEPYTTYRHLFNVWSVVAVSKDGGYDEGTDTAFECRFTSGSTVEGNDEKCLEYASNAVSEDRLDEALVIVVMNSSKYGGTCYMYPSVTGSYGMGAAVAYIPFNGGGYSFSTVLQHEAGGHGFAKLADEYSYFANGTIPASEAEGLRQYEKYGWYRNVDFTDDRNSVKWAAFLDDERYADEGLNVYEGAFSYAKGVWRSTSTSIMKSNSGVFNAPSREAIWCRIHRLAYGSSWKYDREDFVEYDAVNRTASTGR